MGPWCKRCALVAADVIVLLAAGLLTLVLQTAGMPAGQTVALYGPHVAIAKVIFLAVFGATGVYRRLWRYAGVRDLLVVLGACAVAGIGLLFAGRVPLEFRVLFWLLATGGLSATRLGARVVRELRSEAPRRPRRRVLIAGAGDAGAELVRELRRQGDLGLEPVAFVDDQPQKRGRSVNGVPVAGSCGEIGAVAHRLRAHKLIIAMPSAPGPVIRSVWSQATAEGLPVQILPSVRELNRGQRLLQQLRDVRLEDLLGRPEVCIDLEAIRGAMTAKVVLVTGAGGSIGAELSRQVAAIGPAMLVLVGHGENSLFDIEMELRSRFPRLQLHAVVADIQDRTAVDRMMERFRPDVLFHAAAHKHVPLMERNPGAAVKNNIIGTFNVAASSDLHGVELFVLISTDKAVHPASIMGTTKRAAERVVRSLSATSRTRFITVRFGNVLGSRGSVVPFFQQQIARGGPVTVTHPDATRYFMTIPEAARLVMQAAAMGSSGELFVLDMGEPVRVFDLAVDLIRLAGLEPGAQIPIVFTGLRPGEKVTEELFTAEESLTATRHQRIFRTRAAAGVMTDLAGAIDRFRAMAEAEEAISPASILAALDQCAMGGDGPHGSDCELVRRTGGGD